MSEDEEEEAVIQERGEEVEPDVEPAGEKEEEALEAEVEEDVEERESERIEEREDDMVSAGSRRPATTSGGKRKMVHQSTKRRSHSRRKG